MTAPPTAFVAEPGRNDAVTTAVIDAPRETVFRALEEPDLFVQWWGPPELESRVDAFDVRTGGSWRVVNIDPDGREYAFRGVFHEVKPGERIIQTFEFEALPGHVCLQTTTLEDLDGKTRFTEHVVFQTVADRDGMKDTGMEAHAPIAMAQLAAVVATL